MCKERKLMVAINNLQFYYVAHDKRRCYNHGTHTIISSIAIIDPNMVIHGSAQ